MIWTNTTIGLGLTPFGLTPFGLTPFGLTPFGLTPFGLTPFGLPPIGLTPTGLTPNLTNQMGVVQNFYHPNGWVDQHFRASYAHSGFVKPVCINKSYRQNRTGLAAL